MNNNKNKRKDYIVETEREFLAQLLTSVSDDYELIDRYGADAQKYFVNQSNERIYRAMLELAAKQKTLDCVAIAQLLSDDKQFNYDELTAIQDKSDYSLPFNVRRSSADTLIAIMHDGWARRQLKKIATNEHI